MSQFGQRFYDEEEAEQILRLASSMSSPTGAMSRDRLLDTAAELGISPEAVELAEKQLAAQKSELAERSEFDKQVRRDFYSHLASYLIVNGFLCAMNLHLGGYFWAIWPILGWGIGMAFSVIGTFSKNSGAYQEEFDKWREKRQRIQNRLVSSGESQDRIIERFVQKRYEQGREAGKIEAIRYLREKTHLGLADAKDAVDQFSERNPGLLH